MSISQPANPASDVLAQLTVSFDLPREPVSGYFQFAAFLETLLITQEDDSPEGEFSVIRRPILSARTNFDLLYMCAIALLAT